MSTTAPSHKWRWFVIYDNDEVANESELGGFANVEIDRVRALVVEATTGWPTQHVVHIRDGARPIFFRRKRQLVRFDGEEDQGPVEYATVVGWQKTVNGVNVKSMTFLFPDGSMSMSDRDIDEL